MDTDTQTRLARLHQGVVDMHFDLLMDLYEKRDRANVLNTDYLADLQAGGIGIIGAAIYLEDKYVPELSLRVALDQIAKLYAETTGNAHFALCKGYADITAARNADKIAILITLEGIEPLGSDIHLLRAFYELGVRSIGLTHVRRNMAGDGGVFASSGSSRHGLSAFGKDVVQQCEALGIMLDLAHLNPAGVDDVLAFTTKPLIISHSNPRKFYDIERNSSDDHIKAVGQRGGVVGVNAVLVSNQRAEATLDRYVDHIEYVAELAGMDNVGIGFDFFDHIYSQWTDQQKADMEKRLVTPNFLPDLHKHTHAPNLTLKLIERGFSDADIEKILYGNWLRLFKALL